MRRPTLNRWLKRECAYLAGTEGFNIRKLSAASQGDSPRVTHPLLLACMLEGKETYLMGFIYKKEIRESYMQTIELLEGVDLENLARSRNWPKGLKREYWKHLMIWDTENRQPERYRDSKELQRNFINKAILEQGITATNICTELGINEGNFCSFRHGNLRALSFENAKRVTIYLNGLNIPNNN